IVNQKTEQRKADSMLNVHVSRSQSALRRFSSGARMTRLLCLALPALIVAFSISEMTTRVTNILYVAIGLGLVIFFHELGHFAVAKWCDVFVERFSIGFGPILIARKWGETEYALSAIPFGGYVKML